MEYEKSFNYYNYNDAINGCFNKIDNAASCKIDVSLIREILSEYDMEILEKCIVQEMTFRDLAKIYRCRNSDISRKFKATAKALNNLVRTGVTPEQMARRIVGGR